ncbi:mating-type protein MAT alpha 1 [Westerdykella ornata]|uniref:Mating-type protein MAT-1 n=1 Tax=Westerdykella ornata TaxID=318751 RepID=A0A6A6J4Z5_WESOR|nr:mating-type protein MAT alpha 1 [Westerdykella ornata]KAF2271660.1 mating-type protein MAT alpha 1 [Westerdykella ornata]
MSAFVTLTSFTPAISNTTDKAVKPTKPKKALNAFIGFRCYYISMLEFKAFPMKKLSNMLAEMWNEDTNKPVWALLAKTWSHICNQIGKENVPLIPYFELMCLAMLLPSPDEYFKTFYWELHLNEQNDLYIVHISNPPEDTTTKSGTNMSVEEIICYCQAHNYAKEFKFNGDLATSSTFHVPLKPG